MTLGNDNGTDGQTDGRTDRQTDRRTDRVRRNMRPPPREEGRITTKTMVSEVLYMTGFGVICVSVVSILCLVQLNLTCHL